MGLSVVTRPATAIEVDVARQWRNIDVLDDDKRLKMLLDAATEWLGSPPEGWLGRSIGIQTLRLTADGFGACDRYGRILLPYPPVVAVRSVSYRTAAGLLLDLPAELYDVDEEDGAFYLCRGVGAPWPPASGRGSVRIVYDAGYAPADLPRPILLAVLQLVGQWDEYREGVSIDKQPFVMTNSVEDLLTPFRIWS